MYIQSNGEENNVHMDTTLHYTTVHHVEDQTDQDKYSDYHILSHLP